MIQVSDKFRAGVIVGYMDDRGYIESKFLDEENMDKSHVELFGICGSIREHIRFRFDDMRGISFAMSSSDPTKEEAFEINDHIERRYCS